MNIVHVLVGVSNPEAGNGVSKVVHQLATEQVRAGHTVEVWSIVGGPIDDFDHEYTLRNFLRRKNPFMLDSKLKCALKELPKGAWVQLHSVFIPEYLSIAHRLCRASIGYGTTPHGGYSPEGLKKNRIAKSLYVALVEKRVLSRARMIHVVGESETEDIARLVPGARIILVPNGQAPMDRCEPFVVEDAWRPIFGFVGRLDQRHKGLDILVAGFATYAKQGGPGQLWIVGDGPDIERLTTISRDEGVQTRVRFFGAKFGAEKSALLSAFDVFVHTSRWEGLPLSCLEAAALGLPLIVTKQTNLEAYVRKWESGVVVDSPVRADVASALMAFHRAFVDGRTAVMSVGAARMIANDFRWDEIARQLTRTWEECLDGP